MGGKCGSISRPADEVNQGLWKKQQARLAHALWTARTRVCLALLGGERSRRGGELGAYPASRPRHASEASWGAPRPRAAGLSPPWGCQSPSHVPEPPWLFRGSPGTTATFLGPQLAGALGPAGACAGACCCSVQPQAGWLPCSCQGFPKGSFTRRQRGPGRSPPRSVPPPWAEGGQRPPAGRLATQNFYRPARRLDENTKGLQNTSVVHAFHRDRCRGECSVTRPCPAPAAAQPGLHGMARLCTPKVPLNLPLWADFFLTVLSPKAVTSF